MTEDTNNRKIKRWLTDYEIRTLKFRLLEITKKAEKLGVPAPTYRLTGETGVRTHDGFAVAVETPVFEVEWETHPIRYDGWRLLAVVDHAVGIVCPAPDAPEGIVTEYIGTEPTCDACGHKRHRNHTIVVEDDNGTRLRVGGTCAKDYIGNLRLTPWIAHRIDEREEEVFKFARPDTLFPTVLIVAVANEIIKAEGYTKAGYEFGRSTKDAVDYVLRPPVTERFDDREWRKGIEDNARKNLEEARLAIEWARNLDGDTDFDLNLKGVAEHDEFDTKGRGFGILVYLAEGYRRAVAKEAERKVEAERKAEAVPAPTGRVTTTGKVIGTKVVEGFYGGRRTLTEKVTVAAELGYQFYCTAPLYGLEVGDEIELTVTLTPTDDDPYFAWGKRPAKARLIEP